MSKSRSFLLATSLVVISGCGGGGSSGGTSGVVSPTPQATATTTTGTIAGFGSIVINGTHYNTGSSSFTIDDVSGSQSSLNPGQVVTISGSTDAQGNHAANTVEYNSTVVGPASFIDATNNTLTALGQTLNVDVSTVYDGITGLTDLVVGDNLLVSGTRDASGNVAVTYLKKLSTAPANVRLSGPIANLDTAANSFTIGGATISDAAAMIVPANATLQNDLQVVVVGSADAAGTTITASKVRVHRPFEGGKSGEQGELEGLITQAPVAGSFAIGTSTVNFDSSTVFKGGSASDLIVGARVEVHGALNTDGSLQATKIEVELRHHALNQIGFLVDALSAAPDTTSTPNTISLLGVTVAVSSNTILSDHHHDQSFKLSDLVAGDRIAVAVALTPGVNAGDPATLTALKIERANPNLTQTVAAGSFANADPLQLTVNVETVPVTGQADCVSSGPSLGAAGAGGNGNTACTVYTLRHRPTTGALFFTALADPANANGIVAATGSYTSGGSLVAQSLDLAVSNHGGN